MQNWGLCVRCVTWVNRSFLTRIVFAFWRAVTYSDCEYIQDDRSADFGRNET
jgi:hypothetical protein